MSLVQLTLVAPSHLEEMLVEALLAHPEWASGFTLARAEGHGTRADALSVQEQVRGRAERCEVQVVLEAELARALVDSLKQALPSRDIMYWITPVAEIGRLA
ncbi:MAG: hypothetical protein AMXMBFR45_02660 [Gammaproteobacteria bacterium]|nr:DUF3240 domain-containing protein [Gammaproteobacteria bacterium]MCL4776689.1 DUF3240 family protein [Gammaproteobacteria bacterium]MCQ3934819.1 DUF3240 domain-containing protein [Gammaproteobacteria bacterium]MDL1881642.1 DUF3240 domain-containing protein [Gammaproteobacteria bacterium PRO2]GIK35972.1 MAG: hypothetical protein BroJett010_25310 [Gammaproteobacteria bacterium]